MADVAILIPTYQRSDRLERVVQNASHPDVNVYLIMEPDEARSVAGAVTLTRPEGFGKYTIAANYGYRETTEPLIFSASDDLNFHSGWLEAARAAMVDGIDVVGTNDLGLPASTTGQSSTHHLVRRSYLDRVGGVFDEGPGSFLCEGYHHNYNDTEFVDTAKLRGVWAPCLDAVVEHMHPMWDKADKLDPSYERSRATAKTDRWLWAQRQKQLKRLPVPVKLAIVIPTIEGREQDLARCTGAYQETAPDARLYIEHDHDSCGKAWIAGAEKAAGDGFTYIHFTSDDLEPQDGWLNIALDTVQRQYIPAPLVFHPDGRLESAGIKGFGCYNGPCRDWQYIDGTTVPFMSREMWDAIGMIDTHYCSDIWVSSVGWLRGGWRTVIRRGMRFVHHTAGAGRNYDRVPLDTRRYLDALEEVMQACAS